LRFLINKGFSYAVSKKVIYWSVSPSQYFDRLSVVLINLLHLNVN
jgi:hypothetical protein